MAVVGCGIVGVCFTLYLQRDGHNVIVIDRNGPGEGCSSGNAGQLVTGYCVPVGRPGIGRQVPAMLIDPLAPLTVRWQYLPRRCQVKQRSKTKGEWNHSTEAIVFRLKWKKSLTTQS